jgi:hypothetical protein
MTMPGGTVLPALRIRRDDIYTSPSPPFYVRTISYSFLAKSGVEVEVTALDTTALNSGIIQTDGVTWSSSNTAVSIENKDIHPTQYALYQNNPNPLNTNTSIQYSIGDRQFVKLKVYNGLGTEVSTLVNEVKDPGSYKVNFDASQFSPGNYYYKMQAGSYLETKKMILIR